MTDPDWLVTARAKGLIVSEGTCFGGHQPTAQPATATTTKAKPKTKKLTPPPTSRLSLVVTIMGLRLASESNMGGKLRAKIARKSEVKTAVREALSRTMPMALPVVVTLTRLGGKELDIGNHETAFKAVQDMVAEWLGVDDADKGIRWRYQQKPAYRMGCRICVRERR